MPSLPPVAHVARIARTFIVLVAITCVPTLRATADAGSAAEAHPNENPWSFGAGLGYAHAFQNVRHPDGADVTEPQMLVMAGQVRYELGNWGAPHTLRHSALDLVLEPQLIANFSPSAGFAGAVTAGFRYRLLESARWRPFLIGLAGVGGTDFDLVSQDDGFQFWLEAGLGVRRMLDERLALSVEARFHHISNAGLHTPNAGIDALLVMVGVDF